MTAAPTKPPRRHLKAAAIVLLCAYLPQLWIPIRFGFEPGLIKILPFWPSLFAAMQVKQQDHMFHDVRFLALTLAVLVVFTLIVASGKRGLWIGSIGLLALSAFHAALIHALILA